MGYTRGGTIQTVEGDEGAESSEGTKDRLADIVVAPFCRMGRVVRAEEATRPVTGRRLLRVCIEGGDLMAVVPRSLEPTGGGYLAGIVQPTNNQNPWSVCNDERSTVGDAAPGECRVLCVV